jgi:hypothetical protein
MDAKETARSLNERLSKHGVEMPELRAEADGDQVVLTGSWVLQLPEGRRYVAVQEPEKSDPAPYARYSPDDAIAAVERLLRLHNFPPD